MIKEEYRKEFIRIIDAEFEPIRQKLLALTEKFSNEYPYDRFCDFDNGALGRSLDTLAFTRASIEDNINSMDISNPKSKTYNKSLTRRLRKILGYYLP